MTRSKPTSARSDRDAAQVWIRGALNMIARAGVLSVKIEPLSKEIKVSKGSFYWFFTDVDDLLMRCLDYWKEQLNDAVYDEIRAYDADAQDRLNRLIDTVFSSRFGRFDAAIRAWAMTDARVQGFVTGVDRERLDFLIDVFSQSGLATGPAKHRAHLFYRAFLAESYLSIYPDRMAKGAYLKELVRDLLEPDTGVSIHLGDRSGANA